MRYAVGCALGGGLRSSSSRGAPSAAQDATCALRPSGIRPPTGGGGSGSGAGHARGYSVYARRRVCAAGMRGHLPLFALQLVALMQLCGLGGAVPVIRLQPRGRSRSVARVEIESQDPSKKGHIDLETDIMLPNECLESANARHFALISADGRLTVYSDSSKGQGALAPREPPCTPGPYDKVRWASETTSVSGATYFMRVEHTGNVVVYRGAPPDGKLIWTSSYLKSNLRGQFTLTMSDDGLLKLEHKAINWLVWESVKVREGDQKGRAAGLAALPEVYQSFVTYVQQVATAGMYLLPVLFCCILLCCWFDDSSSGGAARGGGQGARRGGQARRRQHPNKNRTAGQRAAAEVQEATKTAALNAKNAALNAQAMIAGRKIRYVD